MRRSVVYSREEILNRLAEVHGDTVILVGQYINMKTKTRWKHAVYGVWEATPDRVLNRGHSHPDRPRKSRKICSRICIGCGGDKSTSKWHKGPTCHNCYIKDYNKTRLSIYNKLSMRMRKRLWDALIGYSKSASTLALLGCSACELKSHLESRFYPNPKTNEPMTWDNYGHKGWHVDHIIPLSSFDLSKSEQQFMAFNYINLQPLWWFENLSKGDKIVES